METAGALNYGIKVMLFLNVLKKWFWVLAGVFFCTMGVSTNALGEGLEQPEEPPDPLNFDSEDLYDYMEDGARYNIKGFVSGGCKVLLKLADIPIPLPLVVKHITMHVPDFLVNVSAKPFNYLWKDETKDKQEALFIQVAKWLYSNYPTIGGGVVQTGGKGLSATRFKDVEIYGNPWIIPFEVKGIPKIKISGSGKKKYSISFKSKKKTGFYTLAQEHFKEMTFGCWTAFPPYVHIFNSEIDFFWRVPVPYLDQFTSLLPRTVGPGWVPFLGDAPGLDQLLDKVVSPLFPLKGFVTNPIHAHGAAVNALRAAYISTGSWKDFAIWTGHYPQHPASPFHSACGLLSHECKTFTSEEYKWGEDKAGLWQLVAPQPESTFFSPMWGAMALPLDSKANLNYLQLVDKMVPPAIPTSKKGLTNPGEKYSFLHWRCHKCCDIPHGIEGVASIETVWVQEITESCLPEVGLPIEELMADFEATMKKASEKIKEMEGGESQGGGPQGVGGGAWGGKEKK